MNELAHGTARAQGGRGGKVWWAAAAAGLALAVAGCGGNVAVDGADPQVDEPVDEPVDMPSCGGEYGHSFGGPGAMLEEIQLAEDGQCGVVIAGAARGEVDFGGGVLAGAGDAQDVIVVALDALGEHRWSRRFGDEAPQAATSVAVAPGGDVIVGGRAEGTIDLGGGPLPSVGGGDLFVARLDADGQHVWSKRFGATVPWTLSGTVALSPDGDLIVTGVFAGQLDLGGGPMDAKADRAMFAAKLHGDGSHVWSRAFPANGNPGPVWTAVDRDGNIHLTGMFTGTLDLGDGLLTSLNGGPDGSGADMYLAKLGPDGHTIYGRMFGGTDFDGYANRLAVTDDGRAVVAGMYWGSVDFGNGLLVAGQAVEPKAGLFLAAFDGAGKALWSERFGDGGINIPLAVAASGTDVVVAGMSYMTTLDLGGGPLAAPDGYAGFVGRFDASGEHLASAVFEASAGGFLQPTGLSAEKGHLLLGGTFSGATDLGTGPLAPEGLADMVVARLPY